MAGRSVRGWPWSLGVSCAGSPVLAGARQQVGDAVAGLQADLAGEAGALGEANDVGLIDHGLDAGFRPADPLQGRQQGVALCCVHGVLLMRNSAGCGGCQCRARSRLAWVKALPISARRRSCSSTLMTPDIQSADATPQQ